MTTKTNQPERLSRTAILTVGEAAVLLRISINTARSLVADGTLHATKVGRQWRIRRVDVEALLAPKFTSDNLSTIDPPDEKTSTRRST